jgi:hypothetical protein
MRVGSAKRVSDLMGVAKARVGRLWWYAALQFRFSKVENVINLYVGAFLIPAVLEADDLGAVVPFRMIIAFAAFPIGLLTGVAVKFINALHVGDPKRAGQIFAEGSGACCAGSLGSRYCGVLDWP